MASRRRRPTATNIEPTLDKIPDGAWEDFGAEAPELTHEEMLEIAEEREDEAQAIEVFMSMALADTFEALQKAEEESGTADFFDPDFYNQPIHHPAQVVPAKKKSRPNHNVQRVTTRGRKS